MGRHRLGRVKLEARVDKHTPKLLKQLALKYGYQHGANGATGQFLDAIASGKITLTSTTESMTVSTN